MELKMKNCPFCGGRATLRTHNRTIINHETKRNCYVRCMECDAHGKRFIEGDSQTERMIARMSAVDAWNTRDGKNENRYIGG